jgi:hypothetical protein
MDPDAAREYVMRWVETGRLLDAIRWRELRALDERRAIEASNYLVEAALLVPLPASRRQSSGLVAPQALFHGRRPPK